MNKIFKDKKIIILCVILVVFTIGYFIVVNKVSYAFDNDYDTLLAYNTTLETIQECAEKYGKDNIDSFDEEGLLYISVQNLIDDGYVVPNENGNLSTSHEKEPLNNKKIRLKYENEIVTAEIYS